MDRSRKHGRATYLPASEASSGAEVSQPQRSARTLPPVQVVVAGEPVARTSKIPRDWGRAGEIFRFRGPWRFLLLCLREFFRPLFYWHAYYIIQNDILPTLPAPRVKGEFVTQVYSGEKDIAQVSEKLAGMDDLTPAEIALRLRRGDVAAIPHADGEPVGYLWMTFRSGLNLAFHTRWVVRPHEAVLYDTFVSPEWRGRGLHAVMDVALNNWAYPRGVTRAFASISALNNQSLGITRLAGKARVMTLVLLKVRGMRWTWTKASGANFADYFEEEQRASG
jgi:GNAT superfamily N-acetyltransferase